MSKFIGQSCYQTPLQPDLCVHRQGLFAAPSTRYNAHAGTTAVSLSVKSHLFETSTPSLLVASEIIISSLTPLNSTSIASVCLDSFSLW